jgi:hypothetical protein
VVAGRIHWFIYNRAIFVLVLSVGVYALFGSVGLIGLLLGILIFISAWLHWILTETVVTNRR